MRKNQRSFVLSLAAGCAAVLVALGLLQMTRGVALASTGAASVHWDPLAQPPPPNDGDVYLTVVFTDPAVIDVTDLSGNVLGEGMHMGAVRCHGSHCSQKTQLDVDTDSDGVADFAVTYQFKTGQVIDPVEARAVVAGTGILSSAGQKARFRFIATFQDNRDGTVRVRYEASRPDAAFAIPNARGRLSFDTRRMGSTMGELYR